MSETYRRPHVAYEHRGWVRVVMTANTGTQVYMDLDADAAWEFLWGLEWALSFSDLGSVAGTALGVPVVGTVIGALSGAAIGAAETIPGGGKATPKEELNHQKAIDKGKRPPRALVNDQKDRGQKDCKGSGRKGRCGKPDEHRSRVGPPKNLDASRASHGKQPVKRQVLTTLSRLLTVLKEPHPRPPR